MQTAASLEPSRYADVPEPTSEAPRWGPATRMLFRFGFAYLVLYLLPFPLSAFFFFSPGPQWYDRIWQTIVPWAGRRFFQLEITVLPNGSGDTTYNYVQVFCFLVLAAVIALAWTLLDRRRLHYGRLHEWLRVYVRFGLAAAMISYGAIKVIKSQFPDPSLDRLLQPYGDSSPMGLLWTFMGASVSYNIFIGLSEMLGGFLLTARRTTLLGALLCLAVLSNVVMLNFSYDVPVKIYSLHLLLMALFLTLPELRRLANFFLLHRAVDKIEVRRLFQEKAFHRAALVLRTVLILAVTVSTLLGAWRNQQRWAGRAAGSPLYGIWEIDEVAVDGDARALEPADPRRWRRVIFDDPGVLAVQHTDGSRHRYRLELDPGRREIRLAGHDDPDWKGLVFYDQPAPKLLTLRGDLGGGEIRARLHHVDPPVFPLTSRGFHWINEYPFER